MPVVVDAKTDYPVACNSLETLLVHESLLQSLWPLVASALLEAGVTLRADERCLSAIQSSTRLPLGSAAAIQPATLDDFRCEFGSLTLAVGGPHF